VRFPTIPPGTADRVKSAASAARDVLALLFTPVVTAIACWLIAILAYGAWAENTQLKRLDYLGALAMVALVLVGLGGQWFQRTRLEKLKVQGPGGFGGELETGQEATPASVVTTTETKIIPAEPAKPTEADK
jgi:hypothetical protein